MNKALILKATACLASLCGTLHGQTADKGNIAFQYFTADDKIGTAVTFRVDAMGGRTTVGRPLAATEVRHTLQVLGDGTRIDKEETNKYFRDAEGRTRVERDGGATVIVSDPVTGFTAEMNASNKTAHKMMVMKRTASFASPEGAALDKLRAEMSSGRAVTLPHPNAGMAEAASGGAIYARSETMTVTKDMTDGARAPMEDLGTQIVNGVPAKGTRSVITIPAGQIGNDREIRVVSERWFSSDLEMLVKSSNDDPRFGKTTYELTNIIQGAQDASLFQIPADFNVNGPR